MRFFTKLRDFLVYLAILIPYKLLRIMPYCAVKGVAWICGCAMNLIPSIRKLVRANIRTAFPEYSAAEVAAVARRSFHNLALNMAEFVWLNGRSDRIERCYVLPEDITERLKGHVAQHERIIFVNPHLGSWEASGVMAPYYAGVDMVAIAKPVRNPYLNRLLNSGNREKVKGLEIIFSNGAIRAATRALRDGRGVGTLIDQNTRVRDGGSFVEFFGLPVPSSTAPAHLMKYCLAHDIPAVIVYGTSVRHEDGRVYAHSDYLPKPFSRIARKNLKNAIPTTRKSSAPTSIAEPCTISARNSRKTPGCGNKRRVPTQPRSASRQSRTSSMTSSSVCSGCQPVSLRIASVFGIRRIMSSNPFAYALS